MSDTITPASLRAHADWFDTTFEPGSVEARSLRNCAARLEAESARDEYVETLADVLAVAEGGAHLDQLQGWRQTGLRDGVRAVLDRLAADGRLLPEGGTVLTAEQMADMRDVLHGSPMMSGTAANRLRPQFAPSEHPTPPAVSVPDSGPDGTPEKPWPTWQDVPDGVEYVGVGAGGGLAYVNNGGVRYLLNGVSSCSTDSDMAAIAPFVRVDGDKA